MLERQSATLRLPGRGLILANLEGPLLLAASHDPAPRAKAGPSLCSRSLPVGRGLAFSLANNHIMDYGVGGLTSTIERLRAEGISACGAGHDVEQARQPMIVEDGGARIGVVACCEAQFGVARRKQAGVAEFGPWVYDVIRGLRRTVDAVIVSTHFAVEDAPWPSPYVRELYRSLVDAGATFVHGHHAHVPQGYERYHEGVIFYGMGNFAVDPDRWRSYPSGLWSLAAECSLKERSIKWRPLTLEIRTGSEPDTIVVEGSSVDEQADHARHLEKCNLPLKDDTLLDALWQEVALRVYHHHGARCMRFNVPGQLGRRASVRASLSMARGALIGSPTPQAPSRQQLLVWYHMIACESHSRMLATALGVLSGEIDDLRTHETGQLADEMMPWSRVATPA